MKIIAIPGVVPCIAFAAIVATGLTPYPWCFLPMGAAIGTVYAMWKAIRALLEIRADDYFAFAKNLWRDAPTKAMEMKCLGLRDRFEREKDFATAKRCEEDAEALRRGEIPPSMERE